MSSKFWKCPPPVLNQEQRKGKRRKKREEEKGGGEKKLSLHFVFVRNGKPSFLVSIRLKILKETTRLL